MAQAQSLTATAVVCKGEVVSRIDVDARPPFRIEGDAFWQRLGRSAARLHVTTKDDVIKRFLALQVGGRCTELRRAESERILRVQPYLADASVTAYPDSAGGVVLKVVTVDEVTLIVGAGIRAKSPHLHSLRLGEANLFGDGMYVRGDWKHANFRDVLSGKFVDYQFLGRPYQLRVEGGRRELGSDWATELSHPFLTDLQRVSWRTTAGNADGYFYFRRPGAQPAALYLGRSYSDIGGVFRIGPPLGRLALLGGSISFEDENPSNEPRIVGDTAIVVDTSQVLINRYTKHQTARLNALWGVRNIHFIRATGFDALEGAQDLRTGVQVATLVGKGVRFLRGKEDDWFASTEIFGGMGTPDSYAAIDIAGEGRRDQDGQWDGLLAHGRGAVYVKPLVRHTLVSDLTWSGGWRQRIPFQLTFADRDGGLRGFRNSDAGGARRLVARMEDRYLVGRFKEIASIGVAGFVEGGKIWAGKSPFGVNTPLNASVGFSILGAAPPQSRRMWRADFALPVRGDRKTGWEVRLTATDLTRAFRVEPRDIYSSRERSVPSNVFNWP